MRYLVLVFAGFCFGCAFVLILNAINWNRHAQKMCMPYAVIAANEDDYTFECAKP